MSTILKLKKSSVVGKVPGASDLQYGELALNYADGFLYYKSSSNAILKFQGLDASNNFNITGNIDANQIQGEDFRIDGYGIVVDSDGVWQGSQLGVKGEKGATGSGGDKGQKGEIGTTGDKGDKGEVGDTGATGDKGDTGATGDKGQKGEVGVTGDTGATGDKGDTGATGDKGQKGEVGVTGDKGDTGATGDKGDTGATGDKGQKGEVGVTGDTGDKGQKGEVGATGDKGQKGEVGVTGDKGDTGAGGDKGQKGEVGATGDKGQKGQQGNFGGQTFSYQFDTSTTDSDTASGKIRFNNATPGSANRIFIDDEDTGSTDIQAFLRTIDDSTSTIKGHVRISNVSDANDFVIFTISQVEEPTGYFRLHVAYIDGDATFSADENLTVTFARTGDVGDKGAKGEPSTTAGDKGQKGEVGATGDAGAAGDDGAAGDKGEKGAPSTVAGDKGQKGEPGADGNDGNDGAAGDKGEPGAAGDKGAPGAGDKGQKGTSNQSITSAGAPSGAADGDLWFDTDTGSLYIYYVDSDSTGQWIQFNNAVVSDGAITTAKLADDAVSQAKLKDVVTFRVYDSSGTALKTLYGAGS